MSEPATAPWAPLNAAEGFYVTIRRGSRTGALLGPFSTRKDALDQVDAGRELAVELDRFAAFDLFGTTKVRLSDDRSLHSRELPTGRLNEMWMERHGQVQP